MQDGRRRQHVLRRPVLRGGTGLRRAERRRRHGLPGLRHHRRRPPRRQRHQHGGQDRRLAPERRRGRRGDTWRSPVVPGGVRRHRAEAGQLQSHDEGQEGCRGDLVAGEICQRRQRVRERVCCQDQQVAGYGRGQEHVQAGQACCRLDQWLMHENLAFLFIYFFFHGVPVCLD
ncbi:hypothetical protein PR202_gb16516 [Eleusine coracana subsp. coracana]|uniref:Uncharacterized protein n=1 Tax=Eleusine coracana subsp. coracana TaxID=191504 RepID=A0AAV5F0N6_ELECO|nr:hypothetical protein PR202_gb16516 [Eleusine coracana subsp. coracana]